MPDTPRHEEPSAESLKLQPVAGSHPAGSRHSCGATQTVAAPAPQIPPTQRSPVVQGLPSSQVAPSTFGGLLHAPVAVSQVPASWQASEAAQTTGLA